MKIVNTSDVKESKTELEKFSEKTITVELTGFEVLALSLVAAHIGGTGKVRSIFSYCGRVDEPICSVFNKIDGWGEALRELKAQTRCKDALYIDDTLK